MRFPRVKGVSRPADNPHVLFVWFEHKPTDDEMRAFQDYLRDEDLPTAADVRGIFNS